MRCLDVKLSKKDSILRSAGLTSGNSRSRFLCDAWKLKAFLHLRFNKERGPLETLVAVFIVHCRVVFQRVLATVYNQRDKVVELRVGIVGIVDVGS